MTDNKKYMVWNCWNQMEMYVNKFYTLVDSAEGNNVFDVKNKTYFDGSAGLWNMPLGHKETRVIDAINKQLNNLDFVSLMTTSHKPSIDLAEKLIGMTNENYYSVFYTNSGSESTDTALKMARGYFYNQNKPQKNKILSLKDAYHGSTYGALSACGIHNDRKKFFPMVEGFIQIPTPNFLYNEKHLSESEFIDEKVKEFENIVKENDPDTIAAFIYEPIQGSNGVNILPYRYLKEVHNICHKNDILIICDEVATGIGRTGRMFASERREVWGDIMLLAKCLSGGYFPIGAVLVKEKIFKAYLGEFQENKEFVHGYTTSGHPGACAAALATLKILEEEKLVKKVDELGTYFLDRLHKEFTDQKIIFDIQGEGLMVGFRVRTFGKTLKMIGNWPPAMIFSNMLKNRGVFSHSAGETGIVLMPPFTIDRSTCDYLVEQIKVVHNMLENYISMNS